ncbi:hypothetical protein [Parasitella parasitica]|uniref:Uncharacterized protein n=1 Tax=Parasitella parasitica TaxID=35722 RepID=A0A0B7NWL9_9FUNG|nr:hypothetical protein [Parasitella parasitica]
MKLSVMANLPNPKSHGKHDTFTDSADNLSVDRFTQRGNTHLWAVSEQIRRDNNKIFAEISVSPTLYHQFCLDPTLQLAFFEEPFMAYPSLSPSAKILQLQRYGATVECGFITGTTGVYAGGGYDVLGVHDSSQPLQHPLDWSYLSMDFSSPSRALLEEPDNVLVLATWAAMQPTMLWWIALLANNTGKKRKVSSGKASSSKGSQKEPSRPASVSTDNGQRPNPPAIPGVESAQAASPAAPFPRAIAVPPASVAASGTLASTMSDTSELPAVSGAPAPSTALPVPRVPDAPAVSASPVSNFSTPVLVEPTHNTRSQTLSSPSATLSTSAAPVCKHCGLAGHQRTNSNQCLKNSKYIAEME